MTYTYNTATQHRDEQQQPKKCKKLGKANEGMSWLISKREHKPFFDKYILYLCSILFKIVVIIVLLALRQ